MNRLSLVVLLVFRSAIAHALDQDARTERGGLISTLVHVQETARGDGGATLAGGEGDRDDAPASSRNGAKVGGPASARDGGTVDAVAVRIDTQDQAKPDAGSAVALEADPDDADGGEESLESGDPEAEAGLASGPTDGGLLYSSDVSDDVLLKRWVSSLAELGSISVGFAEAGRLINGVPLPEDATCHAVVPEFAWGTRETIESLVTVAHAVHDTCPAALPLRVNHIGKREGGYLRPHHSHQSGRDVDIGFYYPPGVNQNALKTSREAAMDLAANWAFVRAVATQTDVQLILLDRRVQKVLFDYAVSIGENREWLDTLFHAGAASLFQHARRHRDHFHVRFFSGRSQELGWRIQPLLAKRSDENVIIHRVKSGDTLGHLASRYGSTVKLIQKANGLTTTQLRVGRTLNVPLRGPCTQCPLPQQVVVPPRHLPPNPPSAG